MLAKVAGLSFVEPKKALDGSEGSSIVEAI
jgi:hypothetical protein